MILAKNEILEAIKKKELEIKPFNKKTLGGGSVDLSLDSQFRIFEEAKPVIISEDLDYTKYTKLVKAEKITLWPGDIVLGITKEKLKLSGNLCGWLQGRTRFARLGLMVHATASFVQPGSDNKQVLEIINASRNPIEIHAGDRVCQVIFERTQGSAKEKTKYTYHQKL